MSVSMTSVGPVAVAGSDVMTYGGLIYVSNHGLYLRGEGQVDQGLYLDSQKDCDFSQSVFVVCPQLRYVASEALAEQHAKLAAKIQHDGRNEKVQRQLDRLKSAVQADSITNQSNEEKMRGTHVRFGDTIQLRHCESHRYLTLRPELFGSELGSMRVQLDKTGNCGSHFRVDAGYKHRSGGDRVQMGDHVVLYNSRWTASLRLDPSADKACDRVELIAAKTVSQTSSLFQVNYYGSHRLPQMDGYLALGNSLWLRHAEHEGLLTLADAAALSEHAAGVEPQKLSTARGMRAGEVYLEPSKTHGVLEWNTTALWLLENVDGKMGGCARWEMEFRLRHVASKRYLAVLQSTQGEMMVTTSSSHAEELTVFKFVSAGDSVQHVPLPFDDCAVWIMHANSRYWVHLGKAGLTLSKDRIGDAFKIRVANQLELRDTLTVIHHLPTLQRYVEDVKTHKKLTFTAHTYNTMREILSRLILFVMDEEESATVNAMSCTGTPRRSRQELMREHGGVELLVEMLEVPFSETDLTLPDMFEAAGAGNISYANPESAGIALETLSVSNNTDRDKLRVVFGLNQLVYRLLMVLSMGHKLNKKACSTYLEVFVGQLGFGLNSAGFLSSLVHENQELLDTIPAESIEQSAELIMSQGRKPRYLRLLGSLCIYKDSGVLRMQEMVCGTLFGDETEALPTADLLLNHQAAHRRQWKQSAVVVHMRCAIAAEEGCGLELLVPQQMVSWHGATLHQIQRFILNALKKFDLKKRKVGMKDNLFDCGLTTETAEHLLQQIAEQYGLDATVWSNMGWFAEEQPTVQKLSLHLIDLLPAPAPQTGSEAAYEWISLRELERSATDTKNTQLLDFRRYFIEYISLTTSLCLGRNYVGINRVKALFDSSFCGGRDGQEVLTAVVMDQELSDVTRGVFAKLLMSLYIDSNTQSHMQIPRLTWVWTKPPELAAATEVPPFVPKLQEFIAEHIKRRTIQVHSRKEKNSFSLAVLGLCHVLVSFGMYGTVEKIETLGSAVAKMLDGRTDLMEPFTSSDLAPVATIGDSAQEDQNGMSMQDVKEDVSPKADTGSLVKVVPYEEPMALQWGRYEATASNQVVMDCKLRLLEVISLIWDLYLDTRLASELHLFNQQLAPLLCQKGQLLENTQLPEHFMHKFNQKAEAILQDPNALCARMHPSRLCGVDLLPLLLDLMQYRSVPLTELAFKQLIALTNDNSFLMAKSCKVQLIVIPERIEQVGHIESVIAKMSNLCENSEVWMDLGTDAELEGASSLNDCLKQLSEVLVQSRSEGIDKDGCNSILEPLVTPGCTVPDASMQQLLRDRRAHKLVVSLIKDGHLALEEMVGDAMVGDASTRPRRPHTANRRNSITVAGTPGRTLGHKSVSLGPQKLQLLRSIFVNAFAFLTNFVSGNNTNKQSLATELGMLLGTLMGTDFGQSLLITQIVKDFLPEVSSTQIELIFQHMLTQIESFGREAVFLKPLIACIISDGVAVRHQQETLMNHVLKRLDAVFGPVTSSCAAPMDVQGVTTSSIHKQTDVPSRNRLTASPFGDGEINCRLVIHVNSEESFEYDCTLMELLAECCVGGAAFAISKCQRFLPLDILLDMLLDPQIPWRAKYSCSRFLMNVYLKHQTFLRDMVEHALKLDDWWEAGIAMMDRAAAGHSIIDGISSDEEMRFVLKAFLPTIMTYFGVRRVNFTFAPIHLKKLFRLAQAVEKLVGSQLITELVDLQVARCFSQAVRHIEGSMKGATLSHIEFTSSETVKGGSDTSGSDAVFSRATLSFTLDNMETALDAMLPKNSLKKALLFLSLKNSSVFWYRSVQSNIQFNDQRAADTRRTTAPARIWDFRNKQLHEQLEDQLQEEFANDLLKCNPSAQSDSQPEMNSIVKQVSTEYRDMMKTFTTYSELEALVTHLIKQAHSLCESFTDLGASGAIEGMLQWEQQQCTLSEICYVVSLIISHDKDRGRMQAMVHDAGGTDLVIRFLSATAGQQLSDELLFSLLDLGISLLSGGNTKAQQCIYDYISNPNHRPFFATVKNYIMKSIEELEEEASIDRNSEQLQEAQTDKQVLYAATSSGIHTSIHQRYCRHAGMRRMLRFLQLLVENHFTSNQNILRTQNHTHEHQNIDLVSVLVEYFEAIALNLNKQSLLPALQVLDTLIELVQGPCLPNQIAIVEAKFVTVATLLLREFEWDGLTSMEAAFVKSKCTSCLLALIEGQQKSDAHLRIVRLLPAAVITENIARMYTSFQNGPFKGKYTPAACEVLYNAQVSDGHDLALAFSLFILAMTLVDNVENFGRSFMPEECKATKDSTLKVITGMHKASEMVQGAFSNLFQEEDQNDEGSMQLTAEQLHSQYNEAFSFFAKWCGHVEIVDRNDKLLKLYFPKPTITRFLSKEMKTRITVSLKRDNPQAKVRDVWNQSDDCFEELQHLTRLSKWLDKLTLLRWLVSNLQYIDGVEVMVSLMMNLIILLSVVSDSDPFGTMDLVLWPSVDENNQYKLGNTGTLILVYFLGGVGIWLHLTSLVGTLLQRGETLIVRGRRNHQASMSINWDRVMGKYDGAQAIDTTNQHLLRQEEQGHGLFKSMLYICRDPHCMYLFLAVSMGLVGCFYDPLAFSFHLVGMFISFPDLQNVLLSVVRPSKLLLQIGLLFMVVIIWFSVVAFKFLQDDFDSTCGTLMQCWRVTFDQGFKNDGGIGGFLTDMSGETSNEWHVVGRFVYDNLFFICLLVLLLNILFGVIIDTFAVLRDESAQRLSDMQNVCTICSIECSTFDRQTVMGHKFHIKAEHNMWEYCALLWHLKLKTDTEYTGLESYLSDCCDQGDLRFFPVSRAMSLRGGALWHGDGEDAESGGSGGDAALADEIAALKAQMLESKQQVAKMMQLLEGINRNSLRPSYADSVPREPYEGPMKPNKSQAPGPPATKLRFNESAPIQSAACPPSLRPPVPVLEQGPPPLKQGPPPSPLPPALPGSAPDLPQHNRENTSGAIEGLAALDAKLPLSEIVRANSISEIDPASSDI